MPKTVKTKRAASKTRAGAHRRDHQRERRRKEYLRQAKQKAPAVIADSLSSLRVKPIPTVATVHQLEDFDVNTAYNDLLAAYHAGMKAIGRKTNYDPLKNGKSVTDGLHLVYRDFKDQCCPNGFELDVNEDDGVYYFTIHKECDRQSFWHFFDLNPVVSFLHEKKQKQLLRAFLGVISLLRNHCGFLDWESANLYGYEFLVNDHSVRMEYLNNSIDEEDLERESKKLKMEVDAYLKGGRAWKILQQIKASQQNTAQILKLVKGKRDIVSKWIREAVDLIEAGFCIKNFIYEKKYERGSYYEEIGVRLEEQYTIIWDDADTIFELSTQMMDDMANNVGVEEAVLNYSINKKSKLLPLEVLEIKSALPQLCTKLFHKYSDLTSKIKDR